MWPKERVWAAYIQRQRHRPRKPLGLETRVFGFFFPSLMAQFVSGSILSALALDVLQFADLLVFYRHVVSGSFNG